MSTQNAPGMGEAATARRGPTRVVRETKLSYKTTELLFYLAAVVAVLIASAVVDETGQGGFGAERAWLYITILTVGYMISRGLAKAGSQSSDDHDSRS